jgi:hypothetical protein
VETPGNLDGYRISVFLVSSSRFLACSFSEVKIGNSNFDWVAFGFKSLSFLLKIMDLDKADKRFEEEKKKKELEKATKAVKDGVGKDALKLLEESGLNVNSAIGNILSEKIKKEETGKKAFLQTPREETSLTSELVYLMDRNKNDIFQSELQRRLALLNLSTMQKAEYVHSELEALDTRRTKPSRDDRWTVKYFIFQGTTKEDLLKPEECTLSEIITIFDDADAARVRDHHWLADETMKAIKYVLIGKEGRSPYYAEFDSRVGKLGWKDPQHNSYVKNECMLTSRWKWHYDDAPAWQENTMVKD